MISETYSKKIDSCLNALAQLEIEVESIIKNYKDNKMPDSEINKSEFFNSILKKDLKQEHITYMNSKLEKLQHFRDHRKTYEYGIDLVLGWIIEDGILELLKQSEIHSILTGNDRYREFLHPRKISTQPDIEIEINKKNKKFLEIMFSWKDTWFKKGHIDLRDSKLKKLKEHKALFLGIEPISAVAFLMDFEKKQSGWKQTKISGYGGKMGYTNNKIKKHLKSLKDILKIVKNMN